MLQVPVYYDDNIAIVQNQDSLYNSPEFTNVVSDSPYQSYQFESSSPESNAVEDPIATTGYQAAQARPHLKLTRPIEVRPNRNYLRADGVARGDVDFPSFDSEFRTLYGGEQENQVGGLFNYGLLFNENFALYFLCVLGHPVKVLYILFFCSREVRIELGFLLNAF